MLDQNSEFSDALNRDAMRLLPGKTMLAKRFPTIRPMLSEAEAFENGSYLPRGWPLRPHETLMPTRPFRSPHDPNSEAEMSVATSRPINPTVFRDVSSTDRSWHSTTGHLAGASEHADTAESHPFVSSADRTPGW